MFLFWFSVLSPAGRLLFLIFCGLALHCISR
jgi:hypothetical protein